MISLFLAQNYPYPTPTINPFYTFQFYSHFFSPYLNVISLGDLLFIIKLLTLIVSAIFLLLIVYYVSKAELILGGVIAEQAPVPEPLVVIQESTPVRRLYDEEWRRILNFVRSQSESEWKLAVIEGDKIVDDALIEAGFLGETMGERLMQIEPSQLPFLQDLWDAHKFRNFLVHDITATIDQDRALQHVTTFEKTLRALEMLS
jgi:hypothetical protein